MSYYLICIYLVAFEDGYFFLKEEILYIFKLSIDILCLVFSTGICIFSLTVSKNILNQEYWNFFTHMKFFLFFVLLLGYSFLYINFIFLSSHYFSWLLFLVLFPLHAKMKYSLSLSPSHSLHGIFIAYYIY